MSFKRVVFLRIEILTLNHETKMKNSNDRSYIVQLSFLNQFIRDIF